MGIGSVLEGSFVLVMWYSLSYGSGLYLCICLCYSFDMGIRKESGVLEYSFLFEGINGV